MAFGLVLYRVSVGRVLGRLLWLTGKCVQLNWSILLDGYKKRSLPRQPSYEAREKTEECKDHRLYRATPPGRDTGKGYQYRFLFIFFLTAFPFCFSFYNQFLLCVSWCLLVC